MAMKMTNTTARRALKALAETFSVRLFEIDGCVVIDEDEFHRHRQSFLRDPTGLEAFVNHLHLEDVTGELLPLEAGNRATLVQIGEQVIRVWADRLSAILKERQAMSYLGGADTVPVRFHLLRRESAAWLDLADLAFLRKERITAWLLTRSGLELVLKFPAHGRSAS